MSASQSTVGTRKSWSVRDIPYCESFCYGEYHTSRINITVIILLIIRQIVYVYYNNIVLEVVVEWSSCSEPFKHYFFVTSVATTTTNTTKRLLLQLGLKPRPLQQQLRVLLLFLLFSPFSKEIVCYCESWGIRICLIASSFFLVKLWSVHYCEFLYYWGVSSCEFRLYMYISCSVNWSRHEVHYNVHIKARNPRCLCCKMAAASMCQLANWLLAKLKSNSMNDLN